MNGTQPVEEKEVGKKKFSKVVSSDPLSPVGIRLGEDLRAAVELEAEQRGVSLGEVCRELIQDGMKDSPKRQDDELFRSLAIAKQHLARFIESQIAAGKGWLGRGGTRANDARQVIKAIDELQEELNPAKSWLHRED